MTAYPEKAHQARRVAESFGTDPARYDRTRPSYPGELVRRIVEASPGPEVLDVGCGTGIAARQLQAAGCRVLGVEVDARMAAFARDTGVEVEVARFEDWDAAGRTFDAVVAGTTWHWVDPVAGARRAALARRPGGMFAADWNVQQPPPEVAEAFAEVYGRVLPGTPFARGTGGGMDAYAAFLAAAADGLREAGGFGTPERWRVDWERVYTRDEWLDLVPTAGGHSTFEPNVLEELLAGLGGAIDAAGGSFAMRYAAVAVAATRAAAQ
jgi:SAM-dependent methyltransferase